MRTLLFGGVLFSSCIALRSRLYKPSPPWYTLFCCLKNLKKRGLPMERTQLYISTVAAGCDESARRHGLGLEIAEYCTAANLDSPTLGVAAAAARHRRAAERFVFHAPFN